jgi:type III secretion system YscC/HrcC family outer membrane pore protein
MNDNSTSISILIRKLVRWPLLAGVFVVATHALASGTQWTGNRFVYSTNGSSIADTLNLFAAGQHIPVRIDGNVAGVVSGRFDMPAGRFLDMLGKSYGFVWYYDGSVLQVSSSSAQTDLAMRPNFLTAGALRNELDQAGVTDAHFPLNVDDVAGTVEVYGPATYVARVRSLAQRFEQDARKRVHTTVRVVRLDVANAADERRLIDGRTVTVPGAATLLQRRFERRSDSNHPVHDPSAVVEFDAPLPIIEANASTNSLLIRDTPERIDADSVMATDMDVRASLISIETLVVDVDADALDTLQPALPPTLAAAAKGSVQSGVGVMPDAGRALLARLGELEKSGRAKVEVSRTAVTLDMSPAVIDQHAARLAQEQEDDPSEDAPSDVWLSVQPTIAGAVTTPQIGLHVELGRSGEAKRDRILEDMVAPGECLVIVAPGQARDDARGRLRLVLLIPHIAS